MRTPKEAGPDTGRVAWIPLLVAPTRIHRYGTAAETSTITALMEFNTGNNATEQSTRGHAWSKRQEKRSVRWVPQPVQALKRSRVRVMWQFRVQRTATATNPIARAAAEHVTKPQPPSALCAARRAAAPAPRDHASNSVWGTAS